jgi:hypothetical protein
LLEMPRQRRSEAVPVRVRPALGARRLPLPTETMPDKKQILLRLKAEFFRAVLPYP